MSVLFARNFAKASASARTLASYILVPSYITENFLKMIQENIARKGRGMVPLTPTLNQPMMAAAGDVCGM